VFDGATVKLDRLYFDAAGAQVDTLPWFTGTVEPAPGITATEVKLTVKDAQGETGGEEDAVARVSAALPEGALLARVRRGEDRGNESEDRSNGERLDTAGGWVQSTSGLSPRTSVPSRHRHVHERPVPGEPVDQVATLISGNVPVRLLRPDRPGPADRRRHAAERDRLFGCDKSLTACTQHSRTRIGSAVRRTSRSPRAIR
jgi:hypothetical protein